jgi:hypothetical protein
MNKDQKREQKAKRRQKRKADGTTKGRHQPPVDREAIQAKMDSALAAAETEMMATLMAMQIRSKRRKQKEE